MKKLTLVMAGSALALGACASRGTARPAAGASAPYAAAVRLEAPPPAAPVAAPVPVLVTGNEGLSSAPMERGRRAPGERVEAANRAAVREPSGRNYVNAAQVHAWAEGALYRLYTAPERVSEIALEPGETLVSVAAGDTARWVIGDTLSGSGKSRRTHILVKPTAAGLRTNLVIATDRRAYHVELESRARTAMTSLSWTYPAALLALAAEEGGAAPVAAGIDLEALDFGYAIEGDAPAWRPVRAFDDGQQVFIEFPPGFAGGEAPPLFVRGAEGRSELVNYRVRGRFYVVDRLFDEAELRLGERRQQVVRIRRGEAGARRRRGRPS